MSGIRCLLQNGSLSELCQITNFDSLVAQAITKVDHNPEIETLHLQFANGNKAELKPDNIKMVKEGDSIIVVQNAADLPGTDPPPYFVAVQVQNDRYTASPLDYEKKETATVRNFRPVLHHQSRDNNDENIFDERWEGADILEDLGGPPSLQKQASTESSYR